MMGIDQAGVAEVIQQTLKVYPTDVRHQLAQVRARDDSLAFGHLREPRTLTRARGVFLDSRTCL